MDFYSIFDGCPFLCGNYTNSTPNNFMSPIFSQHKGVLHLLPYKASYEAIPIVTWWLLLYVKSTNAMYSS
jgi:hypothetical protein